MLCTICKDKGVLVDAVLAWDCGEQAPQCPYCPSRVDEMLVELAELRQVFEAAQWVCSRYKQCPTGILADYLKNLYNVVYTVDKKRKKRINTND